MRLLWIALGLAAALPAQTRWTEKAANDWYAKQPWLVGANYVPAIAINQLEMWQQDSFDPVWIETELNWAEGLGMNTMRVFLHDLPWKQDATGFRRRIDKFLSIPSVFSSSSGSGSRTAGNPPASDPIPEAAPG